MWAAPSIPFSVMWFFWRLWFLCIATGNYYLADEFLFWRDISYEFQCRIFFFFHFNLQNRHSVWMLPLFLRGLETKHSLCLKKYFHKTVLLCDTFKTGWKNWLKLLYVFRHVILEQPAFFGQQVTWIAKKASW